MARSVAEKVGQKGPWRYFYYFYFPPVCPGAVLSGEVRDS